jgi:hypothetical protein
LAEPKKQRQDRKAKLGFIKIDLSELNLQRSSQWGREEEEEE